MTTGEIIFYAGLVLLVFTIILAIIFKIKKPVYNPKKPGDEKNMGNNNLGVYQDIADKTEIMNSEDTMETEILDSENIVKTEIMNSEDVETEIFEDNEERKYEEHDK